MRAVHRLSLCLPVGAAMVLTACQPAKRPPAYPPPPVVETVMPTPPNGAAADMDLPDKDAQGKFITPNRGMAGQQALWHVRMALNVAALGCRGANDTAVQYNRMLHVHKATLTAANNAVDGQYEARWGRDWLLMREKTNTVVYNFFALPPAQTAFCQKAMATVTIINGLTPEALLAYAPKALEELEQPFQDFWEAYADYLRRLEEWRRRYGRPSVKVEAFPDPLPPAPVAPAAPMGAPPPSALPTVPPTRPSQLPLPNPAAPAQTTPPRLETQPLPDM